MVSDPFESDQLESAQGEFWRSFGPGSIPDPDVFVFVRHLVTPSVAGISGRRELAQPVLVVAKMVTTKDVFGNDIPSGFQDGDGCSVRHVTHWMPAPQVQTKYGSRPANTRVPEDPDYL